MEDPSNDKHPSISDQLDACRAKVKELESQCRNAMADKAVAEIKLTPNRPYHILMRYTHTETPKEMRLFLEHLQLEETIFRSDHASNHLVMKGVLKRDKASFLEQIDLVLKSY